MFEEEQQKQNVEDILADTDQARETSSAAARETATPEPPGPPSALAVGKLQRAQGDVPGSNPPPTQLTNAGGGGFAVKKVLALVVVVLFIAGSATAGYFWWQGRQTKIKDDTKDDANVLNETLKQFQQNSIDKALNPVAPGADNTADQEPKETEKATAVDTDQDGLNDNEEATLGTNPRLVDSDGDGLSDWEEVSVFGTNPLMSDTDNDTYPDGSEVQNGYNPKGPGKLLDFEKAKERIQ